LLPQAGQVFHNYYRLTGQADRIRDLYARLDQHEKSRAAYQLERSNVTVDDTLIPHGLSAPELDALLRTLLANPDIITADLGRKELKLFVQQRLYLLCIRTRPGWHHLPHKHRDQTTINGLVKSVHLPGRVLIFAPSGSFRVIARKLSQVPGARILSRR
jgi:hypothetical protein